MYVSPVSSLMSTAQPARKILEYDGGIRDNVLPPSLFTSVLAGISIRYCSPLLTFVSVACGGPGTRVKFAGTLCELGVITCIGWLAAPLNDERSATSCGDVVRA